MENHSSVNSSVEVGTHAVAQGWTSEFTCRCCATTFIGTSRCWEWQDGSWVCDRCASLLTTMFEAGEQRSTNALAFLARPREIRTGWDR